MKPYWISSDGRLVIYHGDSREIVPTLDTAGMLLLADPPYGIGHPTNYGERGRGRSKWGISHNYPPVYDDDRPFDPRWLLDVGAARILWGANYYAHLLPPRSGWLVWDKERPDSIDQSTCELAWTDCVKGVRRFRHLWHGMARAAHEPFLHPTQKPIALMRWCMTLKWTSQYERVLDPYMGSGPVLLAALALGRQAIGIEIDENYCEIAAKRLEDPPLLTAIGLEQARMFVVGGV